MGERPQQPVAEPGGQALALGIERSQVRVEVLARDARARRRRRPSRGAPGRARRGRRRRRGSPARRRPMRRATSSRRRATRRSSTSKPSMDARHAASSPSSASWPRRARPRGRSGRVDLAVGRRRSPAGSIRNNGVPASTCTLRATNTSRTRPLTGAGMAISIFIASTTARRSPASTMSSGRDVDADDERGGRGTDDAGVVPGEPVGDAVDLDQVVAALGRGHDGEAALADREAAAGPPHPLDVDDDRDAVELDLVAGRPDAPDGDAARLPAVPQLDLAADLGVRLRAAAARPARGTSARSSAAWSSLGVDRGGDEGHVGQPRGQVLVGRGEPVEPRRCRPRPRGPPGAPGGRGGTTCSWSRRRTSTVVCDSARCSRASASSRSLP